MDEQTFQTPNTDIQPPRPKSPWPWLGVLVLVLIVGTAGGYWFANRDTGAMVEPEPQVNLTADWRVYRETVLGLSYEFKLPDDFALVRQNERDNDYFRNYENPEGEYLSITITPVGRIRERAYKLTNIDYRQKPINLENVIAESKSYDSFYDFTKTRKSALTVSETPAVMQEEHGVDDRGSYSYYATYLLKDNDLIGVSLWPREKDNLKSLDPTFYEQILSTFRFIE